MCHLFFSFRVSVQPFTRNNKTLHRQLFEEDSWKWWNSYKMINKDKNMNILNESPFWKSSHLNKTMVTKLGKIQSCFWLDWNTGSILMEHVGLSRQGPYLICINITSSPFKLIAPYFSFLHWSYEEAASHK